VTWQNGTVVLLMIATGLMPLALIVQIRGLAHSRSRNRLWKIRDSLVDRLLHGEIQASPSALKLLEVIEVNIRVVARHTLLDAVAAAVLVGRQSMPPLADEILADELRPSDRKQLAELLAQFQRAVGDHLLAGSPSGWLALLATKIYKALYVWRRSTRPTRHKQLREQVELADISVIPAALVAAKRNVGDAGPIFVGPVA
jgi:hypothetical protein